MFQAISGRSVPAVRLLSPAGVLLKTVRGRKSRTDPKAKSKEGRIKMPPPVDPVQLVVTRERYSEYKLIMKALQLEFKEEVLRKKYEEQTGSLAEERARQEAEEHSSLMAWNDAENLRLLQVRQLRMQREMEEAKAAKREEMERREQALQELIKNKEMEILQLEEESKNFITMDNLDQRIEEILDNPKNYNFAIDKEGRAVKQTVLQ